MEKKFLFWYWLIRYLKSRSKETNITTGLTIPYIVGAKTLLDSSYTVDKSSIPDLLNEIVNSPSEEIPLFQECEIGEYVVSFPSNDSDIFQGNKEYFKNLRNDAGEGRLYLLNEAEKFGSSIEEVGRNLNDRYLSDLMDKNFSWNKEKKRFLPFEKEELKFINDCIHKYYK